MHRSAVALINFFVFVAKPAISLHPVSALSHLLSPTPQYLASFQPAIIPLLYGWKNHKHQESFSWILYFFWPPPRETRSQTWSSSELNALGLLKLWENW